MEIKDSAIRKEFAERIKKPEKRGNKLKKIQKDRKKSEKTKPRSLRSRNDDKNDDL